MLQVFISQNRKPQSAKNVAKKFWPYYNYIKDRFCAPTAHHNPLGGGRFLQCTSLGLCLCHLCWCCYSYYGSEVLIALISESNPDRNLVCLLWWGVIIEVASSTLSSHPGLMSASVLTGIRPFHLFLFFSSLSHLEEIFSLLIRVPYIDKLQRAEFLSPCSTKCF